MPGPLDLDPGVYGAYVWPAYAVTAAVLLGLVLDSLGRARRWRREVRKRERERTS